MSKIIERELCELNGLTQIYFANIGENPINPRSIS